VCVRVISVRDLEWPRSAVEPQRRKSDSKLPRHGGQPFHISPLASIGLLALSFAIYTNPVMLAPSTAHRLLPQTCSLHIPSCCLPKRGFILGFVHGQYTSASVVFFSILNCSRYMLQSASRPVLEHLMSFLRRIFVFLVPSTLSPVENGGFRRPLPCLRKISLSYCVQDPTQ
jgi:hypothetical protein